MLAKALILSGLLILAFVAVAPSQEPPPFPTYPPPPPTYLGATFTYQMTTTGGSGTYAYLWQQIYGPAPASIATPNAVQTDITMISPGTYVFRGIAVDAAGTSSGMVDYAITMSAGYLPSPPTSNGLSVAIAQIPPPPGTGTDTIPPVINFVRNAAGTVDVTTAPGNVIPATANGVGLTLQGSDASGICQADLKVDNWVVDQIGTQGTPLPQNYFNMRWNQGTITPGTHTFVLRLFDCAHNVTQKTWTMTK